MRASLSDECRRLLAEQSGVMAPAAIDAELRWGRWQPLYRGVYAAFTGAPARDSLLWAAVLRAGDGAALSHYTAAELDGLADAHASAIHVSVPISRQRAISFRERHDIAPPIVIHHSRRIAVAVHPARLPPRTRVEETVLDLVDASAAFDLALRWPIVACARRRTTPAALRLAISARSRLRWRAEITGALDEVGGGVHSVLEYRYVRGVERPHSLPTATRQARMLRGRRSQYLDNLYEQFGVAVELDGQAAHRLEERWRDARRDNFFAGSGIVTLRYGWVDVTERPCAMAGEIARVLRQRGWHGHVSHCNLACAAHASTKADAAATHPEARSSAS
jgi:hypothetical protein